MSQENVEIVRAVYEKWGEGNLGAGAEFFDPHYLFIPFTDFVTQPYYVGPENVGQSCGNGCKGGGASPCRQMS